VAARTKACVYGRSLSGIAGSYPAGNVAMSLVSVLSCKVKVSEMGLTLVQWSPTKCVCVCVCVCVRVIECNQVEQ
jgi:hypothetical protein